MKKLPFIRRPVHRSFSEGGSLFQLPICPPKRKWGWKLSAKACSKGGLLLLTLLLAFSLAHAQQAPASQALAEQATQFPASSAVAKSDLTFKIIDATNNTFGYDVFAGGSLMIHQTSIPAMPGNEGFKTKEDATKVAELVIQKIMKGEMPPTISIDEMKELNAIPLR